MNFSVQFVRFMNVIFASIRLLQAETRNCSHTKGIDTVNRSQALIILIACEFSVKSLDDKYDQMGF